MGNGTPLTPLEASFLAMENRGHPLHVAALLTLDAGEPVTMSELRHQVTSRLGRLPRFRQKVTFSPLALRRPEWTRVSRMKLDLHLFHHRLSPPGRRSQLFALCARIHETPLARDRPLWEMHLIDGLEGDGQALLIKMHHAVCDGIAGVGLAQILFDGAPATRHHVELPPTHFVHGEVSPFNALQRLAGLAFTAARGPIVSAGPFNGPVGSHRQFTTATLPMEAVVRAKRQLGGTIDDVLVAVVAAGLRRYLDEVGFPQIPHALRAMLPVSTRAVSHGASLGNYVTAVFVDLPLDTDDLPELVRRVGISKSTMRTVHAAEGAAMAVQSVALLPNPVFEYLLHVTSRTRFAHLILSDVPGAREPLFMLGRRITACYPMMPLSAEVGLSIAAVSMDEVMGIGITADPGLVPEPRRLAKAIEWAFAHYARSSGTYGVRGAHRAA